MLACWRILSIADWMTRWLDDKSDSLNVLIKDSDGANYMLSGEETLALHVAFATQVNTE